MSRDSKNVKGDIRSQCADDRKDEVYELMRLWKGRKVVKRTDRKERKGGKAEGAEGAERRESGRSGRSGKAVKRKDDQTERRKAEWSGKVPGTRRESSLFSPTRKRV